MATARQGVLCTKEESEDDDENFSDEEIAELKEIMDCGHFVEVEFAPNGEMIRVGPVRAR